MDRKSSINSAVAPGEHIKTIVRRVDTRQWWLWCSAMVVTLLAMAGIAFIHFARFTVTVHQFPLVPFERCARGLLGLVLLFNVYVVYEQLQINRIRKQVAEEDARLSRMETQTPHLVPSFTLSVYGIPNF